MKQEALPARLPSRSRPRAHTIQKARRKAAAADANNRKLFKRTEFGRKRIPSLPVRLALGLVVVLGVPFVLVYRAVRGAKRSGRMR